MKATVKQSVPRFTPHPSKQHDFVSIWSNEFTLPANTRIRRPPADRTAGREEGNSYQ